MEETLKEYKAQKNETESKLVAAEQEAEILKKRLNEELNAREDVTSLVQKQTMEIKEWKEAVAIKSEKVREIAKEATGIQNKLNLMIEELENVRLEAKNSTVEKVELGKALEDVKFKLSESQGANASREAESKNRIDDLSAELKHALSSREILTKAQAYSEEEMKESLERLKVNQKTNNMILSLNLASLVRL